MRTFKHNNFQQTCMLLLNIMILLRREQEGKEAQFQNIIEHESDERGRIVKLRITAGFHLVLPKESLKHITGRTKGKFFPLALKFSGSQQIYQYSMVPDPWLTIPPGLSRLVPSLLIQAVYDFFSLIWLHEAWSHFSHKDRIQFPDDEEAACLASILLKPLQFFISMILGQISLIFF